MSDNVKENIRSHATWWRALSMLLFVFIYQIAFLGYLPVSFWLERKFL